MERRTLIRLLIGLAIGIPVAVEAVTFFGLVERQLVGGDGGTPAGTATPDRVGVGDELIPATAPNETVTGAEIRAADTPWLFVLSVEVENTLEVPYEVELATLWLGSGDSVAGGSTTGRIPAGETGQVTGAWEIPESASPSKVTVRTTTYRAEETGHGSVTVDLAKVPVRGS
ncbi:MAG: hypothetical protein U5J98_01335 [Halobacteriales archaeon]|nr:hypothetical protein [Halobacteriales archaeon]